MGISLAVAFSLITIVAFSTFVSMEAIYQRSQETYNGALVQFRQWEISSQDTNLRITGVSDSGQELMVNVTNTGSTSLYDFSHFAVIVDYYQNVSGVASRSLSLYSYSTSLAPYTWESEGGIISPSTSGVLEVTLPGSPYNSMTLVVELATSVGPSAEWSGIL